jgi:glutamate--cysteine ligase
VDVVLARVRRKYKEYGIKEKPFVVVKADHGTHELGIVTVRDAKDLQAVADRAKTLNRKRKTPLLPHGFMVQEGVLTQEHVNDSVAEPVIYTMDRYVVGGYYRVLAGRGADETLKAPGSAYVPLAFEHSTQLPQPGVQPGVSEPNRFYMYGVVGRLAMLAASYELEATDPDAEVYD